MKKSTLNFTSSFLEKTFSRHHFNRSCRRVRYILTLASVAYALWSITDIFLFKDEYPKLLPMRFSVCAVALASLGMSYLSSPKVKENFHWALMFVVLVSLAMTTAIDYVQQNNFEDAGTTGVVIVLAGTGTLLKLTFFHSLIVTNLFVVLWAIIAIAVTVVNDDSLGLVAVNLLVVFGANVIFLVSNYDTEKIERLDFAREALLFCNQAKLQAENKKLRDQVEQFKTPDIGDFDLEAPVQKIMTTLRDLATSSDISPDHADKIKQIMHVLNSSKDIYRTDVATQLADGHGKDRETDRWLYELAENRHLGSTAPSSASDLDDAEIGSISSVTLVPLPSLSEAMKQKYFETMNRWDFDIFSLEKEISGNTLHFVAAHLFQVHNCVNKLGLDQVKLHNLLKVIEKGYRAANAYHNALHATDVVHATHYWLHAAGMRKNFTDQDVFCVLFASAIHDYDHPGTTNAYHIATSSRHALLYNDRSPLEMHHVAAAFILMQEADFDILGHLETKKRMDIRTTIIDLVLATDLAKHFELVTKFTSMIQREDPYNRDDPVDRLLLLQMVIKASDVSNPTKPKPLMQEWTDRYFEETYMQGDMEREKGLQISPFMDRTNPQVAKCEVGFISFLIKPLFSAFAEFNAGTVVSEVVHKQLEENFEYWKQQQAAEEANGSQK
eukprot:TRINITY_DN1106_c0_g1_i2.p1 TRINITY_DN1106_c0_g1~~TRINITY_DN1106_c0_g1_i2.p1  ORF type:complete len:668 (-),score=180.08 TRINITY_DN1106_c0_g1_i2:117-2120(-)